MDRGGYGGNQRGGYGGNQRGGGGGNYNQGGGNFNQGGGRGQGGGNYGQGGGNYGQGGGNYGQGGGNYGQGGGNFNQGGGRGQGGGNYGQGGGNYGQGGGNYGQGGGNYGQGGGNYGQGGGNFNQGGGRGQGGGNYGQGGGNYGQGGGNYGQGDGNYGQGGGNFHNSRGGGNFHNSQGAGNFRGQGGDRGRGAGNRPPKTFTTVNDVPAATIVPFDQCLDVNMNPISSEKVVVNSYGVKLSDRQIFKYELKFWGHYSSKQGTAESRKKDLSRIPKLEDTDDDKREMIEKILPSSRRQCLTRLYDMLFEQYGDYFEYQRRTADGYCEHVYAYDRSSIFFCSLQMKNREHGNSFAINIDGLNKDVRGLLNNPDTIYASLVFAKPLNLDSPLEVETYLEVLFSQHQLDQLQRYVKFDNKIFDLESAHIIGGGCELKDGHEKSANVEKGKALCNLQIDARISPFYSSWELLNYINVKYGYGPNDDFVRPDIFGQLQNLKGIYVRTTHKDYNEIFRIHSVTKERASDIAFKIKGENTNVAAYFQTQFNYPLNFPHFPCAVKKVGTKLDENGKRVANLMYYPLEVLLIQQGQKYSRDNMNGQQEQAMIKKAQCLPGDLMENIANQKVVANIIDSDQYIRPAGLQISNDMTVTDSDVLAAPLITYQSSAKSITFAEWDISMVRFVAPATINFLAVFFQPGPQMNQGAADTFAQGLHDRSSQLGLRIGNHGCTELRDSSPAGIQAQIIEYRDMYGVDFVIGIADGSTFHHALKSTEIATGIATQQVQPKTIASINNPNGATMGNIIQKLNLKKGGMNQYFQQAPTAQLSGSIDVFKSFVKDALIIGIFLSHPSPGKDDAPSVCGYAFSTADTGNVTRGGFLYVKPRQTALTLEELQQPISTAVKLYYEQQKRYPNRVLVYRYGASEGEYENVLIPECQCIKSILGEVCGGREPKLSVVVVRRQHNSRIFKTADKINPRDRAPQQNVLPGTCVRGSKEKDVVMVPHKALQGTAKPTIYSTIECEEGLSQDVLKNITHALCYMHEIVNSPISVPAHLRSADQMATRGQNLWNSMRAGQHHFNDPDVPDEDNIVIFNEATNTLNPNILTRYWA